jgi:hypothetical protein
VCVCVTVCDCVCVCVCAHSKTTNYYPHVENKLHKITQTGISFFESRGSEKVERCCVIIISGFDSVINLGDVWSRNRLSKVTWGVQELYLGFRYRQWLKISIYQYQFVKI